MFSSGFIKELNKVSLRESIDSFTMVQDSLC